MIVGILFGTLCLFLFMMAMRPRRRFSHTGGGRCGPGHHHRGSGDDGGEGSERGPRGRGRWSRASWLHKQAGRRLNLDEHQQEVVEVAARQADKAIKTFTEIVDESRDELADAVKGETIDQARLDAVFEKWDESMLEARKDVVDALRRGHATLDTDQRRRLSEWIGLAGWSR
ncbi:MAG: putative membrane protein [Kiritimatiellia bacterium]|jgi:uncharacterized membrane protein